MPTGYLKKQKLAHGIVKQAIEDGTLIRPSTCELCDHEPKNDLIMAHHWQGYDEPLNVLWVCRSCNRILAGIHDGSLTRNEAREYTLNRKTQSNESLPFKGIMKSRVKCLSMAKGIDSAIALHFEARITRQTAKKVWDGYLDRIHTGILKKVAQVLNCKIADLYEFGIRKPRGLFKCTHCQIILNADVNGAFGILNKVSPSHICVGVVATLPGGPSPGIVANAEQGRGIGKVQFSQIHPTFTAKFDLRNWSIAQDR